MAGAMSAKSYERWRGMSWLHDLFWPAEDASTSLIVASSLLILMLVAFGGLAIGSVKFRGLGLGIAGVLFTGLAFGHFGFSIDHRVLDFAREFGLILFVYTIGIQVGPGFFASLRRNGLRLNAMAAAIVLLGAGTTLVLWKLFMQPEDLPAAVGLLSGAVTNTPSLAAAGGALREVSKQMAEPLSDEVLAIPQQAYAVAYPFGILGIICAMLLIKRLFRVSLADEQLAFATGHTQQQESPQAKNLEVRNPALFGRRLGDVPLIGSGEVVVSRMLRAGRVEVARPDSVLAEGDVLLAVGTAGLLRQSEMIVGAESQVDVKAVPSEVESRRILVTRRGVSGKTVGELHLRDRFGVNLTRIQRNDLVLPATDGMRLQLGDNLIAVGAKDSLQQAALVLGDSPKQLDHPQAVSVFIGIALGVLVGSFPLYLPQMPMPVKLGLAGGPLVVAIVLSYIGRIGPMVWYMPLAANFMLRELGIVLFLACVGLSGGQTFVSAIQSHGLQWFAFGALITFVPLILVGLVGRICFRMEFMTLCGLLSGSMTDPPALAFATTVTGSDAPSIAYATVYPLTMLLRVLLAQLIVLLFMMS